MLVDAKSDFQRIGCVGQGSSEIRQVSRIAASATAGTMTIPETIGGGPRFPTWVIPFNTCFTVVVVPNKTLLCSARLCWAWTVRHSVAALCSSSRKCPNVFPGASTLCDGHTVYIALVNRPACFAIEGVRWQMLWKERQYQRSVPKFVYLHEHKANTKLKPGKRWRQLEFKISHAPKIAAETAVESWHS